MDKLAKKLVENLEKKEISEENEILDENSVDTNVAATDNAKIEKGKDKDTRKGPGSVSAKNMTSDKLMPKLQTEDGKDSSGDSIVSRVRTKLKLKEEEENANPEDYVVEEEEIEEQPIQEENEEVVLEQEQEEKVDMNAVLEELKTKRIEASDFNLDEDIKAIFKGQDLSEDFKEKATRIYETSIVSTANSAVENMYSIFEEVFNEKLDQEREELAEEYAQYIEDLNEKVNDYLTFVVENWMTENEVPLERTIKSEIAESFMQGLHQLFEENYIEVPETKVDLVQEMAEKIEELEERYNSLIQENVELKNDREELIKNILVEEASADLSEVEKTKLEKLAENIELTDVEEFNERLMELKESFFQDNGTAKVVSTIEDNEEIELNEEVIPTREREYPEIAGVTQSLKKLIKK